VDCTEYCMILQYSTVSSQENYPAVHPTCTGTMDRSLSSDRRDYSSQYPQNRGWGSDRRGRVWRGGGRRFQRGPPQRRGPRSTNRFDAAKAQDPKEEARQQLMKLLVQIGDHTSDQDRQKTQASHIQALVGVVESKPELFLVDGEQSPFVTGLVDCQASFPLQTPGYAALVYALRPDLQLHVVNATVHSLCRDLDDLLLVRSKKLDRSHSFVRVRLSMRSLVLWANLGIVKEDYEESPQSAVLCALNGTPLSITGILSCLVQASVQAVSSGFLTTAQAIAKIVWDTIPYMSIETHKAWIVEHWMEPLNMLQYISQFTPGVGPVSILLKSARGEDQEMEEESDDEEEDDDDGSDSDSTIVCDSWESLRKAIFEKLEMNQKESNSRVALYTDTPWQFLESTGEKQCPKLLTLFPECKSLTALLKSLTSDCALLYQGPCVGIYARLPIFGGSTAEEDNAEDEDNRSDENGVQLYQSSLSAFDSYSLGEAIRDCMLAILPIVSSAGIEQGSAKTVAGKLWSVRFLVDATTKVEFVIIESLVSLVAQVRHGFVLRNVYIWNVIVELTRIAPQKFSPAIVAALSTVIDDYVPSLSPSANNQLATWFAYHLSHTGYQWPSTHWKHYFTYLRDKKTSRAEFVGFIITSLAKHESNGNILYELPIESEVLDKVLVAQESSEYDKQLSSLIWDEHVDSQRIMAFLKESVTNPSEMLWSALTQPFDEHSSAPLSDELASMESTGFRTDLLANLLDKMSLYRDCIVFAFQTSGDLEHGPRYTESLGKLVNKPAIDQSHLQQVILHGLHLQLFTVDLILKWSSSANVDQTATGCWWEFAVAAIRFGVAEQSEVECISDYLESSLSKFIDHVGRLLSSDDTSEKLTCRQVSLVEGCKHVVSFCRDIEVQGIQVQAAMKSSNLASLVRGNNSCSKALKECLEAAGQ